jgi:tartrate-resistant acid phosphatase type 5
LFDSDSRVTLPSIIPGYAVFSIGVLFFMVNVRLVLLLLAALFVPTTGSGQQSFTSKNIRPAVAYDDAASADLLSELPLALRSAGTALLGEADEKGRARLAENLAEDHPADSMDFLISLLDRERSALVRAEIVSELASLHHPKVLRALERRLETRVEESEQVAELAFRMLISVSRYSLPGAMSLGTMTDKNSVRVLAFGDFGSGSTAQRTLASDMLAYHKNSPFDLGITVGDNFYPRGLSSPLHRRWQSQWEDLYTPLGIEFYAILGNHDTSDSASPFAQVLRTKRSASWRMPAAYYTFSAGPVQFFAMDTNKGRLNDEQLAWLESELKKSTASWKVVYGHHPFKSDGEHGDDTYTRKVGALLLPVLKAGGADVYLAGHDHDMQYLKPEGDLNLFVSGGGGKGHRDLRPPHHRLWGRSTYGFTVLEAEKEKLSVEFVAAGGERLCAIVISKDGETKADCP